MVDANVLIAALLRDSTTRKLIVLGGMELHAPRYLLEAVEAHWEELTVRGGLPPAALRAALRTLRGYLIEHGREEYEEQLEKAEAMLQDADTQDAPYVALALAIGADCAWSEDRGPHSRPRTARGSHGRPGPTIRGVIRRDRGVVFASEELLRVPSKSGISGRR